RSSLMISSASRCAVRSRRILIKPTTRDPSRIGLSSPTAQNRLPSFRSRQPSSPPLCPPRPRPRSRGKAGLLVFLGEDATERLPEHLETVFSQTQTSERIRNRAAGLLYSPTS